MKTRIHKLVNRKAFTASDVIDKELKGSDVISFIDIIVRMTNGAAMTESSTVKIHDDITKIEVIDGGDVLASANMEEWQAVNFFMDKKLPYMKMTLEDNAVQTEHCRIMFGYKPYDPNYYLRPNDFDNLEIKVHITMTTAAATAWAASGHDVTIILGLMESGYGDYKGFLSTRFARNYTAVDGTEEIVEIPVTHPLNMIVVQAFKTATRPDENIEIIKLDADDGKHVEMDMYTTELEAQNAIQFGKAVEILAKRMTADSDVLYTDLFLDTWVDAGGGTALYVNQVVSVDCDQAVLGTYAQT
jgi:hypothetical protein